MGWLITFVILAELIAWYCQSLKGMTVIGAMVVLGAIGHMTHTRSVRRLAAQRPGESICTFARAFDLRRVDAAIVRAVYEELQHYFIDVTPVFPVRPSDRFVMDFSIDPQDCEDLAELIAYRTQRPLDGGESNPLWGQVQTVADLVEFFTRQPMIKSV